jgi:hypothetical protein
MSSDDFDLKKFLPDWMRVFGKDATDRKGVAYVKMPVSQYREAFDSLLHTLLENGYERDRMESAYTISCLFGVLRSEWDKPKNRKVKEGEITRAWKFCIEEYFHDPSRVIKHEKPKLEKQDFQGLPRVKPIQKSNFLDALDEVDDE